MRAEYYLLLIILVFVLVWFDEIDIAVIISLFAGAAIIMSRSENAYSSTKKFLDSEYKDFENAKTSNPADIAKDEIKWYGERVGHEFFGKEKIKEPDPIEGTAKGLNELIKVSKKLFKK